MTSDSPYRGVSKDIAFDPGTHELEVADRRELIFFYSVQGDALVFEGTGADMARP